MPVCYRTLVLGLGVAGVSRADSNAPRQYIDELFEQNPKVKADAEAWAESLKNEEKIEGRSLIVTETQNIFKLENYGCWCYADEITAVSKGMGETQDDFDSLCKSLHQNYECLKMDMEAQGQECRPEMTKYTISQLNIQKSAEEICGETAHTMDECQYDTCIIELTYVLDVFKLYIGRTYPDPDLRHNTVFDFDVTCAKNDFWTMYEMYTQETNLDGDAMNAFLHISDGQTDAPDTIVTTVGNPELLPDFGAPTRHLTLAEVEDNSAGLQMAPGSAQRINEFPRPVSAAAATFDQQVEAAESGPIWPEKMCCGDFPNRRPFHPQGGKKRCCEVDGNTYEFATKQCCSEGVRNYGGIC